MPANLFSRRAALFVYESHFGAIQLEQNLLHITAVSHSREMITPISAFLAFSEDEMSSAGSICAVIGPKETPLHRSHDSPSVH